MPGIRNYVATAVLIAGMATSSSLAQKNDDPGVSDTEVKIGQTMPYSGPASNFSTAGKTMAAYYEKINKNGGVNGRKITLISFDDAYSPPKAVEQTRRLVESEEVFAIVGSFGSPTNIAAQKYLNSRKVPGLFAGSGASRLSDRTDFPWTMGWQTSNVAKGKIYAKYLLSSKPNAKIAILYQNDDYGKDYLKGFRDGLGTSADTLIVKELSYEATDPTIDSKLQLLRATGAEVLLDISLPKFSAQAIRRIAEIKWNVLHLLSDASASTINVLKPAGLENSKGVVALTFMRDPNDPRWTQDPGVQEYLAFMHDYLPGMNPADTSAVFGYSTAQTFVYVLQKCGNDLTRANLLRQASSISNLTLPMILPGISLNTSPTQFTPMRQAQIMQFDGANWLPISNVISAD